MFSQYEIDYKTCEKVVMAFLESSDFYGFISPGLISKFHASTLGSTRNILDLMYEIGFDLKAECKKLNVYYSRSASRVLHGSHPKKVVDAGNFVELLAHKDFPEVVRITRVKRTTISSTLNFVFGNSKSRRKFAELGWRTSELPYLPSVLYKPMIQTIVCQEIENKHQLQTYIKRVMDNRQDWWVLTNYQFEAKKTGYIYLVILAKQPYRTKIKIGRTSRPPTDRMSEHKRSGKLNENTPMIFKYSEDLNSDEKKFLDIARRYSFEKVAQKEEFWVSDEGLEELNKVFLGDVFLSQNK